MANRRRRERKIWSKHDERIASALCIGQLTDFSPSDSSSSSSSSSSSDSDDHQRNKRRSPSSSSSDSSSSENEGRHGSYSLRLMPIHSHILIQVQKRTQRIRNDPSVVKPPVERRRNRQLNRITK